jgi:hypothetical protein
MDGDEQLNNCQHRDRLTTPVQLGPDRADHEPTVVEADYPPMIQVAAYSDRELEQAHQVGVEHFFTTPQKFAQPSLDRIARATVCATLRLAVWVPQAVVVLLEVLLEKDPGRRFQNPTDLLKAMPTITGAMGARRKITRRSLLETPATGSRIGTRKPPARLSPDKISLARLPVTGSDVFGREEDIAFLDRAWANKDINVVTIVAWAGVGKSTLVNHWLSWMAGQTLSFR